MGAAARPIKERRRARAQKRIAGPRGPVYRQTASQFEEVLRKRCVFTLIGKAFLTIREVGLGLESSGESSVLTQSLA